MPKRKINVFTSVLGPASRPSSAERRRGSERLINETYTAFLQSFMPSLGRPDVDSQRNSAPPSSWIKSGCGRLP